MLLNIFDQRPLQSLLSGRFTGVKVAYLYLQMYLTPVDPAFLRLKNKYSGKSLYIIGNGPSLTIEDLELIDSHHGITLGVNGIFDLFDKTKWRPDIFLVTDGLFQAFRGAAFAEKVKRQDLDCIICNERFTGKIREDAIAYKTNIVSNILIRSKSRFWRDKYKGVQFSTNAEKYIYDGATCIISAIQLAYYMGFQSVYLLGVDCGISENGKVHSNQLVELNEDDRLRNCDEETKELVRLCSAPEHIMDSMEHMKMDFGLLALDMKKKNIPMHVYNATRGGSLEVFPRIELEHTF